jgi:hypothetical protein
MFAVTESIVKLGRVSIDQGNYLQYLHQAAFALIDVVLLSIRWRARWRRPS